MTNNANPARRACLVVPGSSERMLAKARSISVDEVVIDLEDGVARSMKDSARAQVITALSEGGFAAASVAVRINPLRSPWGEADLAAVACSNNQPTSVVLPKVESARDILQAEIALDQSCSTMDIQALIETAASLRRIDSIASASRRMTSLIIGYADLASSLGRSQAGANNPDLWIAIQDRILSAARAAGIQAIDGPFVAIDDPTGLAAAALRACDLGFDGKWAIHPSQVSALITAFTPTPEEADRARQILKLLDAGAAEGQGATTLEGEMIDEAMRAGAIRTLSRAVVT